ncbi:MAG: hypothetical protein WCT01_01270 [Candidatus Shapirobacteria bacterium]|jgi:hypothetical protein
MDYQILKLAVKDLNLLPFQVDSLKKLTQELKILTTSLTNVKNIIARGGFILDTLLGTEPNDIDLFYESSKWKTKNWQGCECDSIKSQIISLNLPLINSRKTDLGHILENEIHLDPVTKVLGFFSHHIDVASMVCLDSSGSIWVNQESLNCIKNKIHEIRFEGWLQHFIYPYSDNPFYRNYKTSYCRLLIRGLRMIHSKKYLSVGSNYRNLLENSNPLFNEVLNNKQLIKGVKEAMVEKCSAMDIPDFYHAIDIANPGNIVKLKSNIKKIYTHAHSS